MERLDLTGSRNEDWRPTIDYAYSGGDLPLDGATIRLQWRLEEGSPGDPLFDIDPVAFEDFPATEEDIAHGVARAGDRILRLYPGVGVAGMQTLPTGLNAPEFGEADRYVWDAVITYADDLTDRFIGGYVYVSKGVTLNGA